MLNEDFASRLRKLALKKPPRSQNKPKESVTPLRVIGAKPGFPEDPLSQIPFPAAGELLAIRQPATPYIIEGLIPKAGNVLFRIEAGVDAQMFAVRLGVAASAGHALAPYGHASSVTTAMVFKSGSLERIREQVQLSIDHLGSALGRKRALASLHLYHPKLEGKQFHYMTSHYEQAELLKSLPDDCKLLIVYDSAGFMAKKNERELDDYKHFSSYLKKLNSLGIATAVFFQSARKAYAGFEDELLMDAWHNVIDLSPWTGAPREFGGGFTVSQLKISEFDTVPICYDYWYTVIDGKLEIGFECGESSDPQTIKQVEMKERQMRVKEMLARGMQHKTIAAQLGVDAATVSRDVAKIKASERTTSTPALTDLDDVGSE